MGCGLGCVAGGSDLGQIVGAGLDFSLRGLRGFAGSVALGGEGPPVHLNRRKKQRHAIVELAPDLVQSLVIRLLLALFGPSIEDLKRFLQRFWKDCTFDKPAVREVFQIWPDHSFDIREIRRVVFRPGNTKIGGYLFNFRRPILHDATVACEAAFCAACADFSIQNMAKPQQIGIFHIQPVALLERLRHFNWIAMGQQIEGGDILTFQNSFPQSHQSAIARILQEKKR